MRKRIKLPETPEQRKLRDLRKKYVSANNTVNEIWMNFALVKKGAISAGRFVELIEEMRECPFNRGNN